MHNNKFLILILLQLGFTLKKKTKKKPLKKHAMQSRHLCELTTYKIAAPIRFSIAGKR